MAWQAHDGGSAFDDTSLVAYYKLGDALDSSGSGFNLTGVNTPTYVQGLFANCANLLLASDQCFYVASDLGITSGAYTIVLWFLTNSATGRLVRLNDAGTKISTDIYFSATTVYTERLDDVWRSATYTYVVPQGIWHNLIMTFTGANIFQYFNGSQTATIAASGTSAPNATVDKMALGNAFVSSNGNLYTGISLNGKFDECLFFTRAWTAAECALYYARNCQQYGVAHP